MIRAHRSDGKSVSIWAAIGAPFIGVPVMVALLALTAPGDRAAVGIDAPVVEEQINVEPVDVQDVDVPIEASNVKEPLRRG